MIMRHELTCSYESMEDLLKYIYISYATLPRDLADGNRDRILRSFLNSIPYLSVILYKGSECTSENQVGKTS